MTLSCNLWSKRCAGRASRQVTSWMGFRAPFRKPRCWTRLRTWTWFSTCSRDKIFWSPSWSVGEANGGLSPVVPLVVVAVTCGVVSSQAGRRVCSDCGKNYNVAEILEGDLHLPPLLPKVDGVCDSCGAKNSLIQVRACLWVGGAGSQGTVLPARNTPSLTPRLYTLRYAPPSFCGASHSARTITQTPLRTDLGFTRK